MKNVLFLAVFLFVISCQPEKKKELTPKPQPVAEAMDPLASWNKSKTKARILQFVQNAVDTASAGFIPKEERIAVFDNDGTLWCEKPNYFQLIFSMDRIKKLAGSHPEWKNEQPFKAILENNHSEMSKFSTEDILKIVMASHGGLTQEEFKKEVIYWNSATFHTNSGKRYNQMVYFPMLELLVYLRSQGFKTYVVSGGGVYFMRALLPRIYGIPPEQIIGSTVVTNFVNDSSGVRITRTPLLEFVNDGAGKPVNIDKIIGRKPVFCAGNSDGDLAMLQYTASNERPFFNMLIHHTDSMREFVYDRNSHIGRLDKALDVAVESNWTVVDMAADWNTIFAFENE